MSTTIYLAGPEVFLPDGRDVIERKRDLAQRYGFNMAQLHGEFTAAAPGKRLSAEEISHRNEALMDSSDMCIANITPFRGISADPGTVYEIGYMIARKRPVFAYTADPREYRERVAEAIGSLASVDGRLRLGDGAVVEDHGWADNLMIEGGILRRGWTVVRAHAASADPARDLVTFERCLRVTRDALGA